MINKSRKITINNKVYHYRVTGCITVTWQCPDGSKHCWYYDAKPKWKLQVKPSDVRTILLGKEISGHYMDL